MRNTLNKLFSGSERTKVVKKNITGSFAVKGLSIVTSLYLVPLTINLLDQEKYGIWITIFSIVTWFNMMDLGLGNGFRNKYAEAIAKKDKSLATEYLQTFYSSMGLIAIVSLIIFSIVCPFLNWYKILNIPNNFDENITLIVWMVFCLFCVQLFIKNIATILLSLQKTTRSNALMLCGNIIALIGIITLHKINLVSLFSISMMFMIAPIIVFFIETLIQFKHKLREYRFNLFCWPKLQYLHDLVGLGVKFFFIQITTIVMFSAGNIIIAQLFGPAEVTPYNVAFRLFASAQTFFIIIITPFWSAFTEANAKEDFDWIKKSIKKLILIWAIFFFGIIGLWLISPFVYRIWVGESVKISLNLSFQIAVFIGLITWTSIFVYYINGVGKIKLQLYIAIFQCIVNIPLAIILAKYTKFGVSAIVLATNINLSISAILIPIQYKRLIDQTANGIWSK
jgi:O-antigen/teichoic acid export membrane protein